jgi:hypothetical protein
VKDDEDNEIDVNNNSNNNVINYGMFSSRRTRPESSKYKSTQL